MSLFSVLLYNDRADLGLIKSSVMDVVLRGGPANIHMGRVLARKDPDPIEVLIH